MHYGSYEYILPLAMLTLFSAVGTLNGWLMSPADICSDWLQNSIRLPNQQI